MPSNLLKTIREDWAIHGSGRMRATFLLFRVGRACHERAACRVGIRRFGWRGFKWIVSVPYWRLMHSFGSYMPYSVQLGRRVRFGHDPYGVFISSAAVIGDDCLIMQHVTIGTDFHEGEGQRSPVIGQRVFIGAGAKIIGGVTVGDDCRIGANAIVVDDLPSNSTAVSPKARVIVRGDEGGA